MPLPTHLQAFAKLRRDYAHGGAPHKPILLLAVLRLVGKKEITRARVYITPELVLEFKSLWARLVMTPHTPNFALPFFHMRTEPFWELVTHPGMEIPVTRSHSIRSLNALMASVDFAQLDQELFNCMLDPVQHAVLEDALLQQYFPETRQELKQGEMDLFRQLETQVLEEDRAQYQQRIEHLKAELSKEDFEEELFVRGGVFKREIPRIYDYQCAISGMRIESTSNAQMVDACHIVPFSQSKDDTIRNGISLSPNLHRAFDRGLITIDSNFKVRVSPSIRERSSPFALQQFQGKTIHLPTNSAWHPASENLGWHQRECFIP